MPSLHHRFGLLPSCDSLTLSRLSRHQMTNAESWQFDTVTTRHNWSYVVLPLGTNTSLYKKKLFLHTYIFSFFSFPLLFWKFEKNILTLTFIPFLLLHLLLFYFKLLSHIHSFFSRHFFFSTHFSSSLFSYFSSLHISFPFYICIYI